MDHLGKMNTVMRIPKHIYGVSKDIGEENIYFPTKPMHVNPQIDCLGQTSPTLRVSTHIYEVSEEIDGKTFIF